MARCNEFGVSVCERSCSASMVADRASCFCAHCGAICAGQFAGCGAVWASGTNGDADVEVLVRRGDPDARCAHLPDFAAPTRGMDDIDDFDVRAEVAAEAAAGATDDTDLREVVLRLQQQIDDLRHDVAGLQQQLADEVVRRLVAHFERGGA